jgi:hypothetical protein
MARCGRAYNRDDMIVPAYKLIERDLAHCRVMLLGNGPERLRQRLVFRRSVSGLPRRVARDQLSAFQRTIGHQRDIELTAGIQDTIYFWSPVQEAVMHLIRREQDMVARQTSGCPPHLLRRKVAHAHCADFARSSLVRGPSFKRSAIPSLTAT